MLFLFCPVMCFLPVHFCTFSLKLTKLNSDSHQTLYNHSLIYILRALLVFTTQGCCQDKSTRQFIKGTYSNAQYAENAQFKLSLTLLLLFMSYALSSRFLSELFSWPQNSSLPQLPLLYVTSLSFVLILLEAEECYLQTGNV